MKCSHGFEVDPKTGEHIIPSNSAVSIADAVYIHKDKKPTPRSISKQEQEQWLNNKRRELELEESSRKKPDATVQAFHSMLNLDNY